AALDDRRPQRGGEVLVAVMTGDVPPPGRDLHPLAEVGVGLVGLEHLDEGVRRGAEVEPVALPGELDLPRVGAAGLALDTEPRAADAEDLVLPAGLVVEDTRLLLPEPDDHRLRLVDDTHLVVVVPAVETVHLDADRPIADLV